MRYGKRYTVTSTQQTRTTCDVCGEEIRQGPWDGSEITIRAEIGEQYPEADCREAQGFDCCVACWAEKIRPALEAAGAKFREWRVEYGDALVLEQQYQCVLIDDGLNPLGREDLTWPTGSRLSVVLPADTVVEAVERPPCLGYRLKYRSTSKPGSNGPTRLFLLVMGKPEAPDGFEQCAVLRIDDRAVWVYRSKVAEGGEG